MDTGLKDKHVLITGASGGIGSATLKLFLQEGAKVSAHYNSNQINIENFSTKEKESIFPVKASIQDEESVKMMFSTANKHFGRIDILVCNAGIWPSNAVSIADMTFDQWQKTQDVNLTGYFLCIKYFFNNLRDFPGDEASIVLIGSTAGVFGEAGHADYSVTKFGAVGLMLSAKNEISYFARKGRVNIVHPGWTVTPMAEESLKDHQMVKKILQTIPVRKIGEAIDIASQIVVLSSNKLSNHVSGQQIVVAGGMEGRVLYQPDDIDMKYIRG